MFVFLGDKKNLKGYKLWDSETRRSCWAGMSHLMRLYCWIILSLS